MDTNEYASGNNSEMTSAVVTNITSLDGYVEICSITPESIFYITDMSLSADFDLKFRFKYDGQILHTGFYHARDFICINKNLPIKVDINKKFAIEVLAGLTPTEISGCIGGFYK